MPFQSPNHTQIPNDLFDAMLPQMGYAELKVTLAILRLTLGWHKERVAATLARLMDMTGLSKQAVIDGAKQAEERGTLSKEYDEHGNLEWAVYLLDHGGLPTRPSAVYLLDRPTSSKERLKKAQKKDEAAAGTLSRVLELYRQNVGLPTQVNLEDIRAALETFPEEWLAEAIREMARARAKSWRYAQAILDRWQRDGFKADKPDLTPAPVVKRDPMESFYRWKEKEQANAAAD